MKIALKELGTIITGNTPSKSETRYWDSDDICFVKPDIISEDGITDLYRSNEHISEYARYKARIVTKDSLFVTCIGSIGKIGLVSSDEMAFNQQINAIIPNEKILPRYLAYSLLRNQSRLQAIANAPVVPIINKTQFGDFLINYNPDKEKQSAIVKILDSVDNIIKIKKRVMKAFDDLIKARFVEMFGAVVDNRFGYEIKSLQDICEPIRDGTHQTPTYTDDIIHGFKFLSSKDVTTRYVDWNHLKYIPKSLHDELYARIAPRKGDILLAKNGTTGVAAVVDRDEIFDIYVSLALLRPLNNINSIYLWAAINSNDVKKQFDSSLKGIGVPNLHLGEIKKAKILVPHISEQMNFEKFVKQIDKSKLST